MAMTTRTRGGVVAFLLMAALFAAHTAQAAPDPLAEARAAYEAGQLDKAAAMLEEKLRAPKPGKAVLELLAAVKRADGKAEEAVGILLNAVEQDAMAGWPLADALRASLRESPWSEEAFAAWVLKSAASPDACSAVLAEAVRRRLAAGDKTAAQRFAWHAYTVAPWSRPAEAIRALAESVFDADDPAAVIRLMAFLETGPAGPDGEVGTDDDLAHPIVDRTVPLSEKLCALIQARADALDPARDGVFVALRDATALHLTLGAREEAIALARAANDAAVLQKEVAESTARLAQLMRTGPFGLRGSNDWLRACAAPDAMQPLRNIAALLGADGTVPPAVEHSLRVISEDAGRRKPCLAAMLALGRWRETAALLGPDAGLDPAGENTRRAQYVAAAIRAMDGRLARSNGYLLFLAHGQAGADGKAGTADDLADPGAAILADTGWAALPVTGGATVSVSAWSAARTCGPDGIRKTLASEFAEEANRRFGRDWDAVFRNFMLALAVSPDRATTDAIAAEVTRAARFQSPCPMREKCLAFLRSSENAPVALAAATETLRRGGHGAPSPELARLAAGDGVHAPEAALLAALQQWEAGQQDAAAAAAEKIAGNLEAGPVAACAAFVRAWMELQRGNQAGAREWLKRASSLRPEPGLARRIQNALALLDAGR